MTLIERITAIVQRIGLDMKAKADVSAVQLTGTALSFVKDAVYGTTETPITGNITGVTTGAVLGATVLAIHNSTAPTFDSKFKKLSGSGDYVQGINNYIYCQYINDTTILYSINNV